MNKNIKYLIEDIVNFNPVDYSDNESDIVSRDDIHKITQMPENRLQLKKLIKERLKKNSSNPYLLDIDTRLIKNTRGLFGDNDCWNIRTLDLSTWDMSEVTDMTNMFADLKFLKELKISDKFDTSKVKSMAGMFAGCRSLNSLDLSMFNTSKVKTMSKMFAYCE
jgi:surface protein